MTVTLRPLQQFTLPELKQMVLKGEITASSYYSECEARKVPH